MGRRLIEVAELLVDHVHKAGYQHRVLEDSIHAESQKRVAAEKDRDHWKAARQEAIEAGELMQAEIESLRKQLADAQRAASDEFTERQVLTVEQEQDAAAWRQQVDAAKAEAIEARRQRNEQTDRLNETNAVSVQQRDEIAYLRARLDEERSVSAGLRQKLTAAETAVSLQRAGIERFQEFAEKVRRIVLSDNPMSNQLLGIEAALNTLDAEPTPTTEPAIDGDALAAGITDVCREIVEGRREKAVVKDSLTPEAGGGQ